MNPLPEARGPCSPLPSCRASTWPTAYHSLSWSKAWHKYTDIWNNGASIFSHRQVIASTITHIIISFACGSYVLTEDDNYTWNPWAMTSRSKNIMSVLYLSNSHDDLLPLRKWIKDFSWNKKKKKKNILAYRENDNYLHHLLEILKQYSLLSWFGARHCWQQLLYASRLTRSPVTLTVRTL